MEFKEFDTDCWPKIFNNIISLIRESGLDKKTIEMVEYQISGQGKHLRPYLVHILAQAYRLETDPVNLQAAVEFLHNATLAHDDIQDNDKYRRDRLSLWKKFSVNQAINTGDIFIALTFRAVERLSVSDEKKYGIFRLLVKTALLAGNAQIIEMNCYENRKNAEIDMKTYYKIAEGKTGALFSFCLNSVLYLCGKADCCDDNVFDIGLGFGRLYQMRDDIIDLMGLKEGRKSGSDKKAVRNTFPFLLSLGAGKKPELSSLITKSMDIFNNEMNSYIQILKENSDNTLIQIMEPLVKNMQIKKK